MKEPLECLIALLLLQGCTGKVEIPIRHVGVVRINQQVDTAVLKPGDHWINPWSVSEVIIYDVSPESSEDEFDVLFSNSSAGNVKLAIEFTPIVDSMSAFYREYESIYVAPIVDQGTRRVVRDALLKYKPDDLSKDAFEHVIIRAILENHPQRNYVEIDKVDIVELRY